MSRATRPAAAPVADQVLKAARELSSAVDRLAFGSSVGFVYNPLDYAWNAHRDYVLKYARPGCRVVFVGMNPGPWGMAQTGVPFGEITAVRDWLGITGEIRTPERYHPSRPVLGWACARSEVSGLRLWGLFRARYVTPDRFFDSHFVLNYCPLLFLEPSARNVTPDKLPAGERVALEAVCDRHLESVVRALGAECVVGVGGFAEKCAQRVFGDSIRVAKVLHPSPASPHANRDWAGKAQQQLVEQGLWADERPKSTARRGKA
jgi:single-strand selective monofunctional uracil DNA glycosylase